MRLPRLLPALILGLMLVPAAFASVDRKVMLVNEIRSQQQEIRSEVVARKAPYNGLSKSQRDELLSKQSRLMSLLDGKQSTEDLNEEQKTEVFNTLEWIEAVVNNSEEERMVCERRAVLGSNRKERVCKTAMQWREEHEAARRQMESHGVCRDCRSN